MEIQFLNFWETEAIDTPPFPASKSIPEWFKKMNSYMNYQKEPNNGRAEPTIKRCMPFFDAMTCGYLIRTVGDIWVKNTGGTVEFEFPKQNPNGVLAKDLIEFHSSDQLQFFPDLNTQRVPKFISPWGIKTPKGYSVLITNPISRNLPFKILDGFVDTDTYHLPINFPFIWTDKYYNGLLPAGTPIAQVIPVKRESWKQVLSKQGTDEILHKQGHFIRMRFFDKYKNNFRQVKDYS